MSGSATEGEAKGVELLGVLRSVGSATVSDAVELLEVRARTDGYADVRLRRLVGPPTPMVGYAVTALLDSTSTQQQAGRAEIDALLERVDSFDGPVVLVLQEAGPNPQRGCHAGEIMATGAKLGGCVGIVSDSGLRDLAALDELGIHAFGRGAVVSHGTHSVIEIGLDVNVGGLEIREGDLLHGDVDGLLAVPAEDPEGLIRALDTIRDGEEARLEWMRKTFPGCRS